MALLGVVVCPLLGVTKCPLMRHGGDTTVPGV